MTLAQRMGITFNTFIDVDTTVLIGCSRVPTITFTTNEIGHVNEKNFKMQLYEHFSLHRLHGDLGLSRSRTK